MRCILHSDLNNFYASVECVYDPSLRNHPIAVCGDPENRHGIVLAKSDLAKKAGVHIWNEDGLPVYHNSRMITIYAHQAGRHELKLPWEKGRIEDMYTGETHEIQPGKAVILDFEIDECKSFIYEEE